MNNDVNAETLDLLARHIANAIKSIGYAPFDYSSEIKELSHQLSDVNFQLERIADHLEATEAKP